MNIYIFEDEQALNLEPITLTRPAFEVRCGAFTCIERLNLLLQEHEINLIVRKELADITREAFPGSSINPDNLQDGVWLLGNALWDNETVEMITNSNGNGFYIDGTFVGGYLSSDDGRSWMERGGPAVCTIDNVLKKTEIELNVIHYLWNAVSLTNDQVEKDLDFFSEFSSPKDGLYVHDSVKIGEGSVIDASNGPVIIAQDSVIKPLSYIEGPAYIGEHCVIEPMAQVKGGCSIGPVCKLGGEVNSVVIQGLSNKVHDGHIGDAYIGQWVNLGAGTVNSNLKNNYSDVDVMVNGTMIATGSKHIGCFLGDHVKTAIGTTLNTGTVIGPGSNIVASGFPSKTIPSFSWCVGSKIKAVRWNSFLETVMTVKSRRGMEVTQVEKQLLEQIYRQKKTQ